MIVWIVFYGEYDDKEIRAIFSSEDKARDFLSKERHKYNEVMCSSGISLHAAFNGTVYDHPTVEEWTIDEE